MDRVQWNLDILDVIEALDFEQPFRHVLRRNTNPRNFGKADGRYFRRSLLSRPRFTANQSYGCGRRKRGQHAAPILSGLTSAVLHLHDKSPLRGASTTRSHLQLTLDLVEETPVRGLGNDLAGIRFDHAHFAQSQGKKPD